MSERFSPPPGEEFEQQKRYPAMTEWDIEFQKKIEKLTPDEQLLTREQETELASAIQAGKAASETVLKSGDPEGEKRLDEQIKAGQAARDTLVVANLRLASWFVRETMDFGKQRRLERRESRKVGAITQDVSQFAGGELEYGDRLQIAAIGLIKAAENYNAKRGRFSTYAMYYMEATLMRELGKRQSPITIKGDAVETIRRLNRAKEELIAEGKDADYIELAKKLPLPIERVAFFDDVERAQQRISFEEVSDYIERREKSRAEGEEEPEVLRLADMLPDPGTDISVEDEVTEEELGLRLDETLATLTEREQFIIDRRFGLEGDEPMSFDEVGKIVGLSRERIRQLEAKALARLRHPSRSDKLRDFMELHADPKGAARAEIKLSEGEEAALGIRRARAHDHIHARSYFFLGYAERAASKPKKKYTLAELEALKRKFENQ